MSVKDTTVVRVPNELLPVINGLITDYRNSKKEQKKEQREHIQKLFKSGIYLIDEQMQGNNRVFLVNKDAPTPLPYDRVKNYERSLVIPITFCGERKDAEVHIISGQMYINKAVYKEVFGSAEK